MFRPWAPGRPLRTPLKHTPRPYATRATSKLTRPTAERSRHASRDASEFAGSDKAAVRPGEREDVRAITATDRPASGRAHRPQCWPAENGWYIYDVWESRDHFQRFMDGQLGEAVRAVFGDQPPPPGSEPQFYEIESLAVVR